MLTLPSALRDWASPLSLLSRDLAMAMAPWLPRLDALLGSTRASSSFAGDPDGYAGLARRGSFERLLPGERLLAEVEPDEFLRRLTSGEATFIELASRTPHGARRSVVLFDAGPLQLGAPRLVHIAVLIIMARRAARARAGFAWGTLQGGPRELCGEGLSESTLMRLLAARAQERAAAAHVLAWQESQGDNEILWVGAPELASLLRGRKSFLAVEEPWMPESRRLELTLERAGERRRLALPLPSEALCVRALRDPCERQAPAVSASQPLVGRGSFFFSRNGTRLVSRLPDGSLVATHVPNSPMAKQGKPHFLRLQSARFVAASFDKQFVAIAQQGQLLTVRGLPGLERELTPWLLEQLRRAPLLPCFRVGPAIVFLTAEGDLVRLRQDGLERLDSGVRTAAYVGVKGVDKGLWFVTAQSRRLKCVHASGAVTELSADLDGDGDLACHIGHTLDPNRLAIAVRRRTGRWLLLESHKLVQRIELHIPDAMPVVGVTHAPKQNEPALLLLESEGTSLSRVSMHSATHLLTSSSRIVSLAQSPRGDMLAYATEAGSLVFYSVDRRARVLELRVQS